MALYRLPTDNVDVDADSPCEAGLFTAPKETWAAYLFRNLAQDALTIMLVAALVIAMDYLTFRAGFFPTLSKAAPTPVCSFGFTGEVDESVKGATSIRVEFWKRQPDGQILRTTKTYAEVKFIGAKDVDSPPQAPKVGVGTTRTNNEKPSTAKKEAQK